MNLFKYNLVELYSKSETGNLFRGNEILPDPLKDQSDLIDDMVGRLNEKDKDFYYLGRTKLSGGTEGEKDIDVLLYATDHFFYRYLYQRKFVGGREQILKPAEIDAKFRGDRSLENIRDRELLRKLLSKTAQKIANFYKNRPDGTAFTAFSHNALQGMGCAVAHNKEQMELEFSTFLPHKADKATSKFYSIFLPIDDPMKL